MKMIGFEKAWFAFQNPVIVDVARSRTSDEAAYLCNTPKFIGFIDFDRQKL